MESIIIRNNRLQLIGMVIISGLLLLYFCTGPFNWFTSTMSVIFGLLFSYSAIDLIRNAPQLIISEEGLFVRKHGWYHWDLLDAYWIEVEKDHENEPKEYLMIRLKGGELIKCMIRDFDLSSTEIYSGINRYKSNYSKNIHHQV